MRSTRPSLETVVERVGDPDPKNYLILCDRCATFAVALGVLDKRLAG